MATRLGRTRTRQSTITAGLAAVVLLAGTGGVAQASEDQARPGPTPDLLRASASSADAPVSKAVAAVLASRHPLARSGQGKLQSLGAEEYLIFDEHVDALGDSAKTPELAASLMAVPKNDPTTTFDESSVLLFAGAVSPETDGNDWGFVTLDVNGDLNDDYILVTPDVYMNADEDYATQILRVDGTNWVGTGQPALWSRITNGYVVGLDWRALGLTSTRFAFGLSDIEVVLFDWAPDDYTGLLIALPAPAADGDGDGVTDSQDVCPTTPGPATSGGCPIDSDRDGIIDVQDACPTMPGPAGLSGCPDADGDGVNDVLDACPLVSGAAAYAGCPPPPAAVVKAKAISGRSKLYVDVNPNEGSGYWTFQVQRQQPDGSWLPLNTYKTKGSKETRTINLKKGTYQVVVNPKYGHLGATSAPVSLKK